MTRTCIIGVSGYGAVHYQMLLEMQAAGEAEIVGAAIINQGDEAEKCAQLRDLGCRIFDDHRVMCRELAGSAELCMIPTGTPWHRPMTIAALDAGMHVLVEKPAAGCIEDVDVMQDAARKSGRVVAVGYQLMYAASTMDTKRHILNGAIGNLESIKCLVMWPRDHAYYERNNWAGRLMVDGMAVNDSPFNNAVAHELMMMLFQAGATERGAAMPVSVTAELYRANAIESTDTACMHIETAEGIPIRFYATHACAEAFGPEIHIRGSRGSILMTHRESVIRPDGGDAKTLGVGGGDGGRRAMAAAVWDAVQGDSSFVCDLEIASRQSMVVSEIHRRCAIQPAQGETSTAESGISYTVIPGIEEAMRQAFDQEQMLRDSSPA